MLGLLLFGGVIAALVGIAVAVTAVSLVVGAILWLVLLPFRLLALVLKLAVVGVAGVVGLTFAVVIGSVALLAVGLAILAPLLPVLLIVGGLWMLLRSRRPVYN